MLKQTLDDFTRASPAARAGYVPPDKIKQAVELQAEVSSNITARNVAYAGGLTNLALGGLTVTALSVPVILPLAAFAIGAAAVIFGTQYADRAKELQTQLNKLTMP